jgi:hypothetical protein
MFKSEINIGIICPGDLCLATVGGAIGFVENILIIWKCLPQYLDIQ